MTFDIIYRVTESDWRMLAIEALQCMNLDIARKAFIRVRDMRYVELLNRIEQGRRQGVDDRLHLAEILAYQGKYQDAAKMYAKANHVQKAMEMFSDLRQFEQAKVWAENYAKNKGDSSSVQELMQRQAEWSEEVNDYQAAADMYLKVKKYDKAINILGKQGNMNKLIDIARALAKTEVQALKLCIKYFRQHGQMIVSSTSLVWFN